MVHQHQSIGIIIPRYFGLTWYKVFLMVFKSYRNISFGHQGYTAIVHLLKNLAVFLNFLSSMGIIFFNFIYASMVIAPKVILF